MKKISSFLLFFIFYSSLLFSQRNYKEHVNIVRDKWGVPHIYGEKDADVAYGLAWANAEDDFQTMQESLLPAKAMLGRWKGKEGAVLDFAVQFMRSKEITEEEYDQKIAPEFKTYLEGYCAGINDYARLHPKEVKVKQAFPVTPKDVVASFHYIAALITAFHQQLQPAIEGKFDSIGVQFASNAYAVNHLKSENGNSMLVINPHVKLEGLFSWYEAHLISEEGMNIMGALFHGGTSIFVGANQNLGWSHTWNKYDLVDTYRLKMHPTKKLYYEYDGEWKKLICKKAVMKVKLKSWMPVITVKKKFYLSEIGPVLESKNGVFYAIRWGAMNEIRTAEQWWKMNKANNYEEFYAALKMNALPRFNVVYADKNQQLLYIDDGIVPIRKERYNWKNILPGNTSKSVWSDFYKTEDLPQVKNPECGYVFNMNNTPFSATCEEEKMKMGIWDEYMDYRTGDNNRSLRFIELINEKERVTFEDLKRIKFDNQYPQNSAFLTSIDVINKVDANKYEDVKDMILEMQRWDKKADSNSLGATYFLVTLDYVFHKQHANDENFLEGIKLSEELYIEAIRNTKKHLLTYFKSTNVPLKQIQVIRRGNEEYAMPGFPDVLAANYSKKRNSDGKFEGFAGDTYTMIVEFGKNGIVRVESLVNFGSSAHPESKHYTDQLKLWIHQQTKKMTFDKQEIFKNAERIYKPGN